MADRVDPSALSVEEAAALLRIEPAVVRRHIEQGLPVDDAGRIHLVEYVAWMAQRLGDAGK